MGLHERRLSLLSLLLLILPYACEEGLQTRLTHRFLSNRTVTFGKLVHRPRLLLADLQAILKRKVNRRALISSLRSSTSIHRRSMFERST